MSAQREKLLRELIKKLTQASQNVGVGSCFNFGEENLTRPQTDLLFFVAPHNDGVSVKEIAEEFHVTSGAITQVVDVLVSKKLLSRKEDPSDRRVLRIRLTPHARQQFSEFEKGFIIAVSEKFEQLTDDEINELISLLSKVQGKFCSVKGGGCI